MKTAILFMLFFVMSIALSRAQACIDTVDNGLIILNKFNFNGPDCLFSVKFCVRKTSVDADEIEYTVFSTGVEIKDSIDVSGNQVGDIICRVFTFVANCNSTASFVAVGKKSNNSICGVVAELIDLPIHLLDFSGEMKESGIVELNWETVSESNSSHFIVQRSKDGKSFSDLAKVNASGESNIIRSYSYSISETVAISVSYSYYRLKMVDKDQQYTFSPIIGLVKNKSNVFEVYPNPSSSILKFSGSNILSSDIRLYNIQGMELSMHWLNANTIDLRDLNSGIYLIKYQDEVRRIIKQ